MIDQNFSQLRMVLVVLIVLSTVCVATAQTDSLQVRLENAATLIRDNRIPEAERQLNAILKTAPNDSIALNLLGTVRAQQGRLNEAEVLLTRAVRNDPKFVPVHMNLAFLYLLKNAPEKTIYELKEALRLEPDNSEASYKLARLLLSRGQIDECIAVVETAKETQQASPALLVLLGEAYLRKTNTAKAEEAYLLAVSLQTNNVDAILGLAQVAQVKGDTKAELLYLSQAKELAGGTPDLHYRVGTTALKLGVFDEAQTALERAVKLSPDSPAYLIALGAVWLKKPDLFAAENVFRRALDLQPDNAQAQMYLGYVLYKQKKFIEARRFLERSIKADANTPEPFYYLGLIAQEQNEDETAIELLAKSVLILPSYANAHVALGASYLKLKDYMHAQKELELGAKLNPEDSKAHYQLALLYARLKDPKRAQAEMQIVEKLKTLDQSQKREGDTFVITTPTPNPQ